MSKINWCLVSAIVVLASLIVGLYSAHARDLGQWENTDPVTHEWFKTLMQPDNPTASCCGEADAYHCDLINVRDGKTFCTITDERDDGPLRRPHLDIGTQIEIPDHKLKYDRGNPTGHAIVFVGPAPFLHVWCFVQNGGV